MLVEHKTVCAVRTLTQGETVLRAEAAVVQLVGEGRGAERFNRFHARAAEAWFSRCAGLCGELPEGRYHAAFCCTAEENEMGLTVRICCRLCRRGRQIAREERMHRWLLPQGWILPAGRRAGEGAGGRG